MRHQNIHEIFFKASERVFSSIQAFKPSVSTSEADARV
jgi:hypothetical protein